MHKDNSDNMSSEIFFIGDLSFLVFQAADESFHWHGEYRGMKVVTVLPVDDNSKCLILLEIAQEKEQTFENFLCVKRDGNIVWKAELPQSHDTFVSFQKTAEGLIANTWSGYRIRLDPATGKIVERQFVK